MAALDIHPNARLDELLRRAVAAWRERCGMSARRFGAEALGDPDFVFSQARGRSVRLGTADRVLVFMGLAPLGPAFRREVEAFLEVTGAKASVLGEEAVGPGSSTAPPLSGGAVINLDEEGGKGMSGNGSKHFSTREAAAWLGLSSRTLDRYRVSGDGPAFHGFGSRVRYLAADLEAWASARRVSTSDDGPAGREGKP